MIQRYLLFRYSPNIPLFFLWSLIPQILLGDILRQLLLALQYLHKTGVLTNRTTIVYHPKPYSSLYFVAFLMIETFYLTIISSPCVRIGMALANKIER